MWQLSQFLYFTLLSVITVMPHRAGSHTHYPPHTHTPWMELTPTSAVEILSQVLIMKETQGSQAPPETGVTGERPTHFQALRELRGRKGSGEPQVSSHFVSMSRNHSL